MTERGRAPSRPLPGSNDPLRILVVEDSAADARLLKELVADSGAGARLDLTFVPTLSDAEAAVREGGFDCVLLDLGLPDATGHDNVQRLRAANRWQTVVVMTGLDSEEIALGNLQRGAQDYLVKGRANGEELERIIRRAIERNRVLSEVDRLREEQYFQATHDALTGLPNRQLFTERGHQLLSLADRHCQTFAICYVDLNGFKQINDEFGHALGDSLLRAVGRTFRSVLRDSDTVARVGGDEFLFLLAPIDAPGQAEGVIRRLRERLDDLREVDGHQVRIGASAGIAHYPKDGRTLELLIARADRLMYEDKKASGSASVGAGGAPGSSG